MSWTVPKAAYQRANHHAAVAETLSKVIALREHVHRVQQELLQQWAPHVSLPQHRESLANLAAYIGLRRHDLRTLQRALTCYGLSSLGRSESHVMASLDAVVNGLSLMTGEALNPEELARVSAMIDRSEAILRERSNALLGAARERATRVMVTLPTQAAEDPAFVRDLLIHGMDCARINCAHDDKAQWLRMVRYIRRAEKQLGRACRIFMDLGGPKLRTGPLNAGPEVLHVKVKRDAYGKVIEPAMLVLTGAPRGRGKTRHRQSQAYPDLPRVGVAKDWLNGLRAGDRLTLRDAPGRKRGLIVEDRLVDGEWRVSTQQSLYITPALEIANESSRRSGKAKHRSTPIRHVPVTPHALRVVEGELILMTRDSVPGGQGVHDDGRNESLTHFCCLEPRIFDTLKAGHQLYIDDGKIRTVVEKLDERGAWLRVQQIPAGYAKLGADKGINVPDTSVEFGALTDKDLADLDFVVQHADIVGLSFVRHASDLLRLSQELILRGARGLAVVAKIETAEAVRNLPEILVHGAGRHSFGIMIARGDLAVEIGYARLAEIQEEILWLCEAAQVPVIWATQVLETLVKTGVPTRAEITDAAMSGRAECVMLNKGPKIIEALNAINNVITRMQAHQTKKTAQYRALHW